MESSFIDEIVKKIIDKINVTGRYKDVFSNLTSNDSSSRIIVKFCEILFNKVWDENEKKIIPAYERVMAELGDKEIIINDYVGRNDVFEATQGEEQALYKIIAPLVAILKNFNEQMPEEMKLVLLADCFNTIAHNLELIFGEKMGQKFWFDLKNDVLLEMINKFDKDSIYIIPPQNNDTVTVFLKSKLNGDINFFSWHSKASAFKNIEGFNFKDYQNNDLAKQIQIKLESINPSRALEKQFNLYNHQVYNSVFQRCKDYKKQVADVFKIDLKSQSQESTKVEKSQVKKIDKENKKMTDLEIKLIELIENIKNAESQEQIENLIKNSGFSEQIKNLRILRSRGRSAGFYASLNVNEKNVIIKCKKEFKFDYKDKCYTKDEMAEIGTTDNDEIKKIFLSEIKQFDKVEPELNKSSIWEVDESDTNLKLSQIDKLIKQSDFTQFIDLLPENEELRKMLEILSHEAINPEDMVSRSVALVLGLDILKKNGAPNEINKLQEIILEILIKELVHDDKVYFYQYDQLRTSNVKFYIELKLDMDNILLIESNDKFYKHMVKEINFDREKKGYKNPLIVKQETLLKVKFNELSDRYNIDEIISRFSDELPNRAVESEKINETIKATFEGGGSYEEPRKEEVIDEYTQGDSLEEVSISASEESESVIGAETTHEEIKMEEQIAGCLVSKTEQLNRMTAELSAAEMYEHILFCVQAMLPEEKFAILEKQLEQMSPTEEYMFLLKMLGKFKPERNINREESNNPGGNNPGEGGQDR